MRSVVDLTEPIDADVDLRVSSQRHEIDQSPALVLGAIALGGGIGAVARYGVAALLPTYSGQFPWSTFIINALGCFLIGILMVLVTEVFTVHHLIRPFFGVGILGGFTTFSTYAVEIRDLLQPGTVRTAILYLVGTLFAALFAVIIGVWLTRMTVNLIRDQ